MTSEEMKIMLSEMQARCDGYNEAIDDVVKIFASLVDASPDKVKGAVQRFVAIHSKEVDING